ncbi:hypothetical protein PTKIN_Ptkin01aG0108000 [Pterospermum kingtungense]
MLNQSFTSGIDHDESFSDSFWRKIWTAKRPSKVKVFYWRCNHNIVPVMFELARRHVPVNPLCPRCQEEEETVDHALRGCKRAKEVWKLLGFSWDQGHGETENEASAFMETGKTLPEPHFQQLVITAWAIWTQRNEDIHNEVKGSAHDLALFVQKFLLDSNSAQQLTQSVHTIKQVDWHPPEAEKVKVNFDGAVDSDGSKGGIRAIIRNHKGECMGALAAIIPWVTDPLTIEAIAATKALALAQHMGFRDIILEGDNLGVTIKLRSPDPDSSAIGNLTDEGMKLMGCFCSCLVQHVAREANKAAHALAKMGTNCEGESIWVEDYPSSIHDILLADVSHL